MYHGNVLLNKEYDILIFNGVELILAGNHAFLGFNSKKWKHIVLLNLSACRSVCMYVRLSVEQMISARNI